jgi:hypothetical protein
VLAFLPVNVAWVWLGLSEVPYGVFLLVGLGCLGAAWAAATTRRAWALAG